MPHAEKRDGKLTGFWYGEVDLRHRRTKAGRAQGVHNARRGHTAPSGSLAAF